MKCCVELPDYGCAIRAWAKAKKLGYDLAKKAWPRPWVAKKTPDGLQFVNGVTSYKNSNIEGTKNVVVWFYCDIGETYLISHPLPKGGSRKYFGRIEANGTIQEVHRDQCP